MPSDDSLFEAMVQAEMDRLRKELNAPLRDPAFSKALQIEIPPNDDVHHRAPPPSTLETNENTKQNGSDPQHDSYKATRPFESNHLSKMSVSKSIYQKQMSGMGAFEVVPVGGGPRIMTQSSTSPSYNAAHIVLGSQGSQIAANKSRNERPAVVAVGSTTYARDASHADSRTLQPLTYQQLQVGLNNETGRNRRLSYLGDSSLPLPGEGGSRGVGVEATYRTSYVSNAPAMMRKPDQSNNMYMQYTKGDTNQNSQQQTQHKQQLVQQEKSFYSNIEIESHRPNVQEKEISDHMSTTRRAIIENNEQHLPIQRGSYIQPDELIESSISAKRAAEKASYAAELQQQMEEVTLRRKQDIAKEKALEMSLPRPPPEVEISRGRGRVQQQFQPQSAATAAPSSKPLGAAPPQSPVRSPFAMADDLPARSMSPHRIREVAGNMNAESVRQAVIRGDNFARFRVQLMSQDELDRISLRQRAQQEAAIALEQQIEERRQQKAEEQRLEREREIEDEKKFARYRLELAKRESTYNDRSNGSSSTSTSSAVINIDDRVVGPRSQIQSPQLNQRNSERNPSTQQPRGVTLPPSALRLLQIRAKVAASRSDGFEDVDELKLSSPAPYQQSRNNQHYNSEAEDKFVDEGIARKHDGSTGFGVGGSGVSDGGAVVTKGVTYGSEGQERFRESFDDAVAAYAKRISSGTHSSSAFDHNVITSSVDSLAELSRMRQLQEEMSRRLDENASVMARVQGALHGISQAQQATQTPFFANGPINNNNESFVQRDYLSTLQPRPLDNMNMNPYSGRVISGVHFPFGNVELPGAQFDNISAQGGGFYQTQNQSMLQAALIQAVNRNQPYHADDSMFGAAAALDGSGLSNGGGTFLDAQKSSVSNSTFNLPRKPLIGGSALPSNSIPGGVDGTDLFIRWVGRGRPMTAPPKDVEIGPPESAKIIHSYVGHGPSGTIDSGGHSGPLEIHYDLDNISSGRSRPSSNAGYRSQDYAAAVSASRNTGGNDVRVNNIDSNSDSALETARSSTPSIQIAPTSHIFGSGLDGGTSSSRTASQKAPFSTSSRAGSAARSHPQQVAQGMPPMHSSAKSGAVDASLDSSVLFVYTGGNPQPQTTHQTPAQQTGSVPTSTSFDLSSQQEQIPSKRYRQPLDENRFGILRAPYPDTKQLQSPAAEAAAILHASGFRSSMTDYYETIAKEDSTVRRLDGEGLPHRFGEIPHQQQSEQVAQLQRSQQQDHQPNLRDQQHFEEEKVLSKKTDNNKTENSDLNSSSQHPIESHSFSTYPQSNDMGLRRESSERFSGRSESRADSVSSNRSSPPLPRNSQPLVSLSGSSESFSEGSKQASQPLVVDSVLPPVVPLQPLSPSPVPKSLLSSPNASVPGSPPGSVRIRPTSAAIVRVGSARPLSSSSTSSSLAALHSVSRPSSVISAAPQQSSLVRDASLTRSSPSSITIAEIQAALNNRNASSSESPFLNEMTEKDSANIAIITGDAIVVPNLVQPTTQSSLQQERINSSPGLAQIPDVDDDEKEEGEPPPPPPPPTLISSPPENSGSSPATAGPLDSSTDSLIGSASRRASITSKYERSQTHGLSEEEVMKQKEVLLSFYKEHAPKRATVERVEENFELFGPRIWQELKMKYGEDKVEKFEKNLKT